MRRGRSERGLAVLVVLVVLAIGVFAGTVALLVARSAGETASQSVGLLQSQLTMRSGVLALGMEAQLQREDVLGGADFVFDVPLEVYSEGGRSGVFRFDATITEAPVSLDALLDVNTADAEMLARLPGVDEALAEAMAAALPVASIRELLSVEGMTVELLFGAYNDLGQLVSEGVPLASLLTVGSVDPEVAVGASGAVSVLAGTLRYRADATFALNVQEGRAVPLHEDQAFQQLTNRFVASQPRSRGSIVSVLREQGVDASSWGFWLDVCAVGAEPVSGRIDINRAPVEVLAVIPGFDADIAQRIVDTRRTVAASELASVLWPLERGLVDEESMLLALDRVTTRSVRWVVRAEAGVQATRDRSVSVDSIEDVDRIRGRWAQTVEDRLVDRVAMDLLVDFSGERPVVVPLGDVTIALELGDVVSAMASGRTRGDVPAGLGRGGRP